MVGRSLVDGCGRAGSEKAYASQGMLDMVQPPFRLFAECNTLGLIHYFVEVLQGFRATLRDDFTGAAFSLRFGQMTRAGQWKGCLEKWINPNIGDLSLSEVNNSALKALVAKMSDGGLSPKTITGNYVPVVKMVVASAVDEQGEQIYPRKWNHEFIDLPVPQKDKQNTPSFSAEVMTGLARWKKPRERMIFILCGAAGLRIGEVLGIEIDKHISSDFLTLCIQQQVRRGKIEQRLKTANAVRQVDLHPAIATRLKQFVARRKVGLLFCTRTGKPLSPTNIVRRHLHRALKELNYMNPYTGTHKAGNHAFRRFRNTYLRNYTECPEGLYKYWMGHAGRDMSDLYGT